MQSWTQNPISRAREIPSLGSSSAPLSRWFYLLVALVATAAYANSLRNGFAFDDVSVVRDNRHVVNLDWLSIWHDNYWPDHDGITPDVLYRPLTLWSYLANQAIAPGLEWTFHLVNVLLHALVSVLASLLAWRLLGNRVLAVVTGLLFAVHPLHTEVVANVVGRAELLASSWSLLALVIFLPTVPLARELPPKPHGMASLAQLGITVACAGLGLLLPGVSVCKNLLPAGSAGLIFGATATGLAGWFVSGVIFRRSATDASEQSFGRHPLHGLLVALCFLCAMLSKETPATLAGAFVLLDLFRWSQWPRQSRPKFWSWLTSQSAAYYVPLTIVLAAYLAMRVAGPGLIAVTNNIHPLVNLLVKASPAERIVTPFLLLSKYFGLFLWPVHLSADYSAPSLLPTSSPLEPGAALGILLCLLAGIISFRSWKKYPQIALLIGLFFSSYFLVANVIRIGTIFAERLFYWPSVFLLILFSWAAVALCRALPDFFASFVEKPGRGFSVTSGPDSAPVQEANVSLPFTPGAARFIRPVWIGATTLLVVALGLMSWRTYVRNTDWADNITLAIATGRDNPNSAKSCLWAGSMLVIAANPDYPEIGRGLLERSASLYPNVSDTCWELAKYYGRKGDLALSLIYVAQAARIEPGSHNLHLAIQGLLADLKRNSPDTYMPELEKYAQENPQRPESYFALAVAYHAQGKWDLAEKNAGEALVEGEKTPIEQGSHFFEATAELAAILYDRGKIDEAVKMYRPFVMHINRSVNARCTMAQMLLSQDPAAHPNAIQEAQMNLDRAQAIDPDNPDIRKTRGELIHAQQLLASGKTPPKLLPWLVASPEDARSSEETR
jgi:tetratricopeptide (TPR) repeat protein